MASSRPVRPAARSSAGPCRARIEEEIIRAYVRLALTPSQINGLRTVRLSQFGSLEARITEMPPDPSNANLPTFWVEIYCHASLKIVDSCGCYEFDEDELAAAVELVWDAKRQQFPSAG